MKSLKDTNCTGACANRLKRHFLFMLALLCSSAGQAALITSPGDPALSGATVDDFSSYPIGDPAFITDGVYTLTEISTPIESRYLSVRDSFNGQFGIVGRSVINYKGTPIEITFADAVNAFGVHIGAADVGVIWTIEAFNSVGTSLGSDTFSVDLNARNNGFFLGWSDPGIGSITLTPSATDNAILDNLAYVLAPTSQPGTFATIKSVSSAIASPADGGPGPVIWYEKARSPNLGSGAGTLTLTDQGAMTELRPDFFGSSQAAFALAGDQTQGAAIAGSEATPYLAGDAASVVVMFQTPPVIATNASILGRRPAADAAGEPKFEVNLLSDGTLQVTTGDTAPGVNTSIGNLSAGTWYYMAITWDLSLPANQVSWYLGKMGELTMSRGFIDQVSVVGDPGSAIRVAGRLASDPFFGAFQNLAIYDRPLGGNAIKNQFLGALALHITDFEYLPGASPDTILRWTDDMSAAYEIVATDALPFGGGSDLLIQVIPANGLIDVDSYPGEVQFSFTDPGAGASSRFWRVQVDLDETPVFIDPPANSASLQAMMDSLGGVGVINIAEPVVIDAPVTIPAGIELIITEGGIFNIQDPAYLAIQGSVTAGLYPVFNGIANFAEGSVAAVKSEWWGSDDYAVNLALLSAGTIPVKVTNDLVVDSSILMNSNQTLDLYGATVFPSAPMTGGAVIKNRSTGATNITISGGTIDGTAESTVGYDAILLTEVDNSLIQDLVCINVHIRSSLDTGNVHLVNTSYTTIRDCDFYDTWKMGIKIDFGSHNTITGGYFSGTHDSGIGAIDSPYLLIDGVHVDNCGTSDASNIAANLQYATIRNSISVNASGTDNGNGITIGHEGYPAIEAVCENNLFINNAAKGVFLQGTTTHGTTVRNNIILNNGVGSSGLNSGGVAVYVGVEDSLIQNNEILGNRLGISFMQTSENNTAENNRIKSSTLHGVRSDGIDNTLKDNELANSSNILNDVNEVNLIKINNTETGPQTIDYSYLLSLPLTDLQRTVLTDFLN